MTSIAESKNYILTAKEYKDSLLPCKQKMRLTEVALSSLGYITPAAGLVGGLGKSCFGIAQTIYGIGLGIFSLPLSCYQGDLIRQKFAFTLISHGIGNIAMGLFEGIPVVNWLHSATILFLDKLNNSEDEKETQGDTAFRLNRAAFSSITSPIDYTNLGQSPLLSYVNTPKKADEMYKKNHLYQRCFHLLTPQQLIQEKETPRSVLKAPSCESKFEDFVPGWSQETTAGIIVF